MKKPQNFNITIAYPSGDLRVVALAFAYDALGSFETGGENRGKIVRAVMGGLEGAQWHWCAGFATWVYFLAAKLLGKPWPFQELGNTRFSSSALYAWAKRKGYLTRQPVNGDLFLLRAPKGSKFSHTHTGLVARVTASYFFTVEGNQGDAVTEVKRLQSGGYDFIHIP